MINSLLNDRKIILGSQSPRRSQLLSEMDISFTKRVIETDEAYDSSMEAHKVAEYIAINKAKAHIPTLATDEIVITADCVVIHDGKILGKPKDRAEAEDYLRRMSSDIHEVVSGVCILDHRGYVSLSETATVKMQEITESEIAYYIEHYNPYDKAGAYGIQEWIGHTKIQSIQGTFTTIMGLPTHRVYEELINFLK